MTMKMNRGIGMVEIMVVVAIIGLFFFGIYELIVLTSITNANQERRAQATQLAQEGVEAVRTLRAQSWSSNIDPLSTGANYYAEVVSDAWTLTATNPGPIDGVFTRTIVFDAVNRDTDDNISPTGTNDPNTRLVTSTVTWQERGANRSLAFQTYLTNFLNN